MVGKEIIVKSEDYQQKLLMKIQELNIAICKRGFLQYTISPNICEKAELSLKGLDKIIKRINKLK